MFRGVFTAIITPFRDDLSIDEEALKKLIDYNIEGGVAGVVPCGTTGESPTLSHEEHDKVMELTVKFVNNRVKVLAGAGSNSTDEAIRLSKKSQGLGCDGVLLVNPYYNKPTQEGQYRHFKKIADSISIPCMLYNIQGRTAVNLETNTLVRLMNDCKNIVSVKEASGNFEQMQEVLSKRKEGFSVLSGDDNIALKLIKAGGDGVVSVVGNIAPKYISDMVKYALEGKIEEASKVDDKLKDLYKMCFLETNPIPIKYMMYKKGMCKEKYRLPLCELSNESKKIIDEFIDSADYF